MKWKRNQKKQLKKDRSSSSSVKHLFIIDIKKQLKSLIIIRTILFYYFYDIITLNYLFVLRDTLLKVSLLFSLLK